MKYKIQYERNRALDRIANAIDLHAPHYAHRGEAHKDADVEILFVNGRLNQVQRRVNYLQKAGIPYVIWQICLRSTKNPSIREWLDIWEGARVVFSYYDLSQMMELEDINACMNFRCLPLGVDSSFRYSDVFPRDIKIVTHGTSKLVEGTRECVLAAYPSRVAHLGPFLRIRKNVEFFTDISELDLRTLYQETQYVSGLRRIEGFELPAAEGLVCGARPILYNRPHYRRWYGNWAEYIEEGSRQEVEEQLRCLFSRPYRSVSEHESESARRVFDWGKIMKEFWSWLK